MCHKLNRNLGLSRRFCRVASFFSALFLIAGAANVSGQDAQDAQVSEDSQTTDNLQRDAALQKAFAQFPILSPKTNAEGQLEFQTLALTNPVVVNRERIYGFKFTVPARTNHEDLVWAFAEPGDFKEWYILPETGKMHGFENFYHTSKGDYLRETPLLPMNGKRLILQSLKGDNLNDGQTYLIWFGFGNVNPPALSLVFTFANFDPDTPHPVVDLEKLLAINQLTSAAVVNPKNHHTYLLVRPTNWERAEKIAQRLGGHLATVRNQEEQDWIFKTFGDYGGTRRLLWTGLNDLEKRFHFSWTSGESASYTAWAPREPNNAGPRGEDYAAIYYPGHAQANKWRVWNSRGRDPNGFPMDGVVEIIPTNAAAKVTPDQPAATTAPVQILPNITLTSSNGFVKLEWPLSASKYILEATSNLSEPFVEFGYSEETNEQAGVIYVTITNPSPRMFFKLKEP